MESELETSDTTTNVAPLTLPAARDEAERQRALFYRHFKDASIALGRYFSALGLATRLTSELTRDNPGAYVPPTERAALDRLRIAEPPLRSLVEEGWVPMEGWPAWGQRCVIEPVKRKGEPG